MAIQSGSFDPSAFANQVDAVFKSDDTPKNKADKIFSMFVDHPGVKKADVSNLSQEQQKVMDKFWKTVLAHPRASGLDLPEEITKQYRAVVTIDPNVPLARGKITEIQNVKKETPGTQK